jgi:hypothetical protein
MLLWQELPVRDLIYTDSMSVITLDKGRATTLLPQISLPGTTSDGTPQHSELQVSSVKEFTAAEKSMIVQILVTLELHPVAQVALTMPAQLELPCQGLTLRALPTNWTQRSTHPGHEFLRMLITTRQSTVVEMNQRIISIALLGMELLVPVPVVLLSS